MKDIEFLDSMEIPPERIQADAQALEAQELQSYQQMFPGEFTEGQIKAFVSALKPFFKPMGVELELEDEVGTQIPVDIIKFIQSLVQLSINAAAEEIIDAPLDFSPITNSSELRALAIQLQDLSRERAFMRFLARPADVETVETEEVIEPKVEMDFDELLASRM